MKYRKKLNDNHVVKLFGAYQNKSIKPKKYCNKNEITLKPIALSALLYCFLNKIIFKQGIM